MFAVFLTSKSLPHFFYVEVTGMNCAILLRELVYVH